MGRKTKLNKEVIQALCDAIRRGLPRDRAAAFAGIHISTIYDWLSREAEGGLFADFSDSLKKAESELIADKLQTISAAAEDDGKWQAAAWILERRFPKDFAANRQDAMDDTSKSIADAIENLRVVGG